MMTEIASKLTRRRILLVEDEFFIAEEMVYLLEAGGAEVLGPVASVGAAIDLIDQTEHIDGAVLDVNLRGLKSWPVADALLRRGVPFIFATGYDGASIPANYAEIECYEKPFNSNMIGAALFGRPV